MKLNFNVNSMRHLLFHLVWHLNLLGLSYIETKQTRNKGNRLTFICGCFCSNNRANNWMQRVRATLSVGQRVVLIENKHLGHWTAFNRWERQPMIYLIEIQWFVTVNSNRTVFFHRQKQYDLIENRRALFLRTLERNEIEHLSVWLIENESLCEHSSRCLIKKTKFCFCFSFSK